MVIVSDRTSLVDSFVYDEGKYKGINIFKYYEEQIESDNSSIQKDEEEENV